MSHDVAFSILKIVTKIEAKTGRRYQAKELAEMFDLHRHTVTSLMSAKGTQQITANVISGVMAACAAHGVTFDANDLLIDRHLH